MACWTGPHLDDFPKQTSMASSVMLPYFHILSYITRFSYDFPMIFLWFSHDFRLGIWMDLGFPSGICHVWGSTVKRVKFPHQPGFGKLAPSPMRNGCNPQGGLLVDRGTQHESKISQRDRTFTSKYGGLSTWEWIKQRHMQMRGFINMNQSTFWWTDQAQ